MDDLDQLTPRERYVRQVFDTIAGHYDAFNLASTGGILKLWQRALAANTGLRPGERALDVCAGTGQLTAVLARQVTPGGHVTGLDFSPGMLDLARKRLAKWPHVKLVLGNALDLPFPDSQFDAVTTGFALRNIPRIQRALDEMARVTKPGGRAVCLELSRPPSWWISRPYYFYLFRILPLMGRVVERATGATALRPYKYLPHSLIPLPGPDELSDMMEKAGLTRVRYILLSGGIACLHVGEKD